MPTISVQAARGGLVPATTNAAPIVPGFTTGEGFTLLQRMAQMLNQSSLVPEQFRGPSNLGNTAIALELASRIGASPLMTMQHLYVVNGRPAWSSAFLIASFNQCGRYSSIRYTFVGEEGKDSWGCYASATEKATGERLDGATVTIGMARAEGWMKRNTAKWTNMPAQMLRYRAASFFIRTYAPEIAMGLRSMEEERDSPVEEAIVVDRPQNPQIENSAAGSPADANSEAAPTPTTSKSGKAARTRVRAVSGESPRKPEQRPLPEADGVVVSKTEMATPEPKTEAPSQEDALDAIEQAFIARCDKCDVAASEMLATYEAGVPGPVDPYEAMHDMLKREDVFGAVLNALAARQANGLPGRPHI